MELRRAGRHGLLDVDDGRQRLVVDLDRLERVLGLAGVSATTAATPSPVHFTLSVARTLGMLTLFWIPALPPAGQAKGNGLYGMSAPVNTATTPGIAFAARCRSSGCSRARTGCAGSPVGEPS